MKIRESKLHVAVSKIIDRATPALLKAEQICGSADALIKKIGISKEHYNYLINGETIVPYPVALKIFIATGGKVSVNNLRLDLKFLTDEFYVVTIKNHIKQHKLKKLKVSAIRKIVTEINNKREQPMVVKKTKKKATKSKTKSKKVSKK